MWCRVRTAAPFWVKEPQNLLYSPGETVRLDCQAEGIPTPLLTWSLNGEPLTGTLAPSSRRPQAVPLNGRCWTLLLSLVGSFFAYSLTFMCDLSAYPLFLIQSSLSIFTISTS